MQTILPVARAVSALNAKMGTVTDEPPQEW